MKTLTTLLCLLIPALPCMAASSTESGAPLTLQAYLGQVAEKNDIVQSVRSQNLALDLAGLEPLAAYSPQLSGGYNHGELKNPLKSASSSVSLMDTYTNNWDLGVGKLFGTGTYINLGYKAGWMESVIPSQDYSSLSRAFTPGQTMALAGLFGSMSYSGPWYSASPSVTINQSLLKNFWGRQVDITADKVGYNFKQLKELNTFKAQSTQFQAEVAYTQLALAKSTVEIQEASLARNQKILAWAQRRANENLGDRVDVLQTQAAVKMVGVQLTQSRQNLKSATRAFNALRGVESDLVPETLEAVSVPDASEIRRKADRNDLRAAEWNKKANDITVDEVIERYKPDLSVFYTYSRGAGSNDYRTAIDTSFNDNAPSWVAGVKLTANIDVPLIWKVVDGAKKASSSTVRDLNQKKADVNRDWANLEEQWKSVKSRLNDVEELVSLQKEKSEREKTRFANGRTTNFQVLSFETDYNNAQLMRLGLIAEARIVAATAKLYNAEY
jgi:outer membrane protein TolC